MNESGAMQYIGKYTPSEQKEAQIKKAFAYHAPQPEQPERYNSIRERAGALALHLAHLCPESRELSLAMTHLEEAVMFANAAIARNEAK